MEKNYYLECKESIREDAKDYQIMASEKCLSYSEIADYNNYFLKFGKRFGLLKEFKENGIL